jgi:hypothetical protein
MNKYSDPDPGSGIKHPGSATLGSSLKKGSLSYIVFLSYRILEYISILSRKSGHSVFRLAGYPVHP